MFQIHDLVQVRPSFTSAKFKGVYRVTAVPGGNRKRYAIESVTTGQKVTVHEYHIETYNGTMEDAAKVTAMPRPGTVVKYRKATYVVTGSTKHGARLALLGGNGSEYTNVPVSHFEVINPAVLLTALTA